MVCGGIGILEEEFEGLYGISILCASSEEDGSQCRALDFEAESSSSLSSSSSSFFLFLLLFHIQTVGDHLPKEKAKKNKE